MGKRSTGRDGSRSGRLKKNNRWLIYSCSVIYFDLLLNVSSLYIFKKRHSKDTQTTLKRHPKDTLRPPGISGKMYHVKVDREHQQKLVLFFIPFDGRQHDNQSRGGLIMGVASKAQIDGREQIQPLLLSLLVPFKDHPFRVVDDDRMKETVESIQEYGVLVPIIVRPLEDGAYEIISGHRRKRACELAGLDEIPSIVRELDDDEATIVMVDSNLQRENILPSERAKAYQMKLEALKHQGKRRDLTSAQVGQKLDEQTARALVAQEAGTSRNQVQRYIRLNSLEQPLLEKVDNGELAFTPAVELSYLNPEEQGWVRSALETTQQTPSLSQAQRIKQESKEGKLTEESVLSIMSEEKKPLYNSVTLSHDTLKKYFPRSYTAKQMEKVIIKLLDNWLKKRQQEQQR